MHILPRKAHPSSDWPEFSVEVLDGELVKMNSPGQTTEPRIVQAKLSQLAMSQVQEIGNFYQRQRTAYIDRMHVKDVTPDINRVRDEGIEELQALITRKTTAIEAMHKDCARRLHDYEHFRHENELTREPHYPEDRLRHLLLAFVALGVESLLNAGMLATGSTGGLIGGWLIAGAIAFLNVGGAFVGGNLARLVNDRAWVRKILGYISVGGFGLLLIAFNLLVAHYREALIVATGQGYAETLAAGRTALESFRDDYFGASDFMSWTLFGLGSLSAALGAWKGYTIEDPYPGFSRRARALKDAETKYQEELEETLDEIAELQRSYTSDINQYADEYRGRLTVQRTLIGDIGSLRKGYESEFAKLHEDVKYLHARHCPGEAPVDIGVPWPTEPLPDIQGELSVPVDQCAVSAREALAKRASEAIHQLKSA